MIAPLDIMRLFTAILLPDDVRNRLAGLARSWRENWNEELLGMSGREYPPAKWVSAENLHVTLKFFGEVSQTDLKPLNEALASVRSEKVAHMRADRMECLPARGPVRIISAGLSGDIPEMSALFERIEAASARLGFAREARPYLPHVTLARLRDPLPRHTRQRLAAAAEGHLPTSLFEIREFVLMQSTLGAGSPRYALAARFQLDRKTRNMTEHRGFLSR